MPVTSAEPGLILSPHCVRCVRRVRGAWREFRYPLWPTAGVRGGQEAGPLCWPGALEIEVHLELGPCQGPPALSSSMPQERGPMFQVSL